MTKTHRIISIILTVLASGMVILSGVMKLLKSPDVSENLGKMGVGEYLPVLGTMEIIFAILFLYPKTMRIGFILLACYFAGAMGTDLSHGHSVGNAMIPMSLVWIAAFVKDRQIFLPAAAQVESKG